MAAPHPPPPETLLQHTEFVRAVARAALGGDALVDDVVQETWLAALQGGAAQVRKLRPWLGSVAWRRAKDVLRRRARQQRGDRHVARADYSPPTSDAVVRAETGRRLVAAVLALAEPYRTAVLLRYQDGLTPGEIAHRAGVPVETARTHIKRGLTRLRRLMEEDTEGRGSSMPAVLLPLLDASWPSPTAFAESSLAGVLVMKKVIIVCTVVLALLAGAYTVLNTHSVQRSPDSREEPVARAESETAPADVHPPTLVGAPVQPARPEPLPYAAGMVVDQQDQPIPGVAILSRGRESIGRDETQEQGFEFHNVLSNPTARTDGVGHFTIAAPVAEQVSLVFIKDGYAVREVRNVSMDPARNQDLRVVLGPGGRFALTVVDTDGRPIPGARINLWCAEDADHHSVFGGHTTDVEGRCVVGWLPPQGLHMVHVGGAAYESRMLAASDILEDQTVVLERKTPIIVVRDSSTGELVGAAAGLLYRDPDALAAILSSQVGRLSFMEPTPGILTPKPSWLRPQEPTVTYRAVAFAPGYETGETSFRVMAGIEPPRVEVGLSAGASPIAIAGTVSPQSVSYVDVRTDMPAGWFVEEDSKLPLLLRLPVTEDGAFVAYGLPPGPYHLVVSALGLAPQFVSVTAPVQDLRLQLLPEAVLVVRVLNSAGDPVPGRAVTIRSEQPRFIEMRSTDDAGVARFEGLPSCTVHAVPFGVSSGLGVLPSDAGTATLEPGETGRLEIRVPERMRVTFRFRDASGSAVPHVQLMIRPNRSWTVFDRDDWERLRQWKPQTDLEGMAIQDLYPGRYTLEASLGNMRRSKRIDVSADSQLIDVAWASGGCGLRGRLLDAVTQEPIPNRPIFVSRAEDESSERVGQGVTDAEGRYEVGGLPSGQLRITYALFLTGPRGRLDPEGPYPTIIEEVTLTEAEWRARDIAVPRVRGDGAEEPSTEMSFRVVDDATGRPLGRVLITVEVARGDLWIQAASTQTTDDGLASGKYITGSEYRVHFLRYEQGNGLTHQRREVQLQAAGNQLVIETSLTPVTSDDR